MSLAVRAVVLRADARALPLAAASVDLIVTSPPFYGLRDYRDGGQSLDGQIGHEMTPGEYIKVLTECTREWMRVLKPKGSIFVNIGDSYYSAKGNPGPNGHDLKQRARRGWARPLDQSGMGYPRKTLLGIPARYAIACLDDLGLLLREDNVWSKINPTPDRGARDRCPRTHEQIFHLVKRPIYYSNPDAVSSLTASVWRMRSQPVTVPPHIKAENIAPFPLELPRRCILGWSPPGGLVVDPFGGAGTVARAALDLGRSCITVDRGMDYCRLARCRIAEVPGKAGYAAAARPPVLSVLQRYYGFTAEEELMLT